ncbi:MAG: hypothetical protein ACE364_04095 [Chlorobiota bacterium]
MNNFIKHIAILFICSFCLNANVMFDEPVNLLQLNTEYNEFAPSWNNYDNRLYFTSDRESNEKLFVSSFNLENVLLKPIILDNPINSAHKNLSYITFLSEDKAYFNSFTFRNGQPQLQIFYSNYKKQSWSEGFILEEIDNEKFTGHCTVSDDKNQLIFTQQSDEGDLDLMVSYRMEDGTWKEPIPLDILNSNGNEITPHIVSNDTLYFASDGQGGPGGYDIYFTIKSEGKWQRPSPLYEINTEYDESDVCVLPNGDLIFSSDRPGGVGGLDLWMSKNNMNTSNFTEGKDLDIEIQSFISKIVVTNNFEYENLPVSKSIYLNNKSSEIEDKFFRFSNSIDLQSLKTIDDSYTNTLNIIGNRLQKDNTSILKITAVYPGKLELDETEDKNSKYFADIQIKRITDFLRSKYGVKEGQIIYNYSFYKDNKQSPRIDFSSSNPKLFEQLEIRNDNIEIEQNKLPINIDISPESELSHWLVELKTSNIERVIYEKIEVEDRIIIDLNEFKKEVFETDYLNIVIKAFNKTGDSTVKAIPHNIEHHISKKPKLSTLNNSKYNVNYMIAEVENDVMNEKYNNTLNEILESITICKSIDIVYNKREEFANSLKKVLESKITNNSTTVNLIKIRNRLKSPILDYHLIEIRVEKF